MERTQRSRKFELTDDSRTVDRMFSQEGVYRIQATEDIPSQNVKAGDLGGFVGRNVVLNDDAWVADNATVASQVTMSGTSRIGGTACVSGIVTMSDSAVIDGNASVNGRLVMSGKSVVTDEAQVSVEGVMSGNARLEERAILGSGIMQDNARVGGMSLVTENSLVGGDIVIDGDVEITSASEVVGDFTISGFRVVDQDTYSADDIR